MMGALKLVLPEGKPTSDTCWAPAPQCLHAIIILLMLVGSLGIVIPVSLLARRQQRKVTEAWSAFALKQGLTGTR